MNYTKQTNDYSSQSVKEIVEECIELDDKRCIKGYRFTNDIPLDHYAEKIVYDYTTKTLLVDMYNGEHVICRIDPESGCISSRHKHSKWVSADFAINSQGHIIYRKRNSLRVYEYDRNWQEIRSFVVSGLESCEFPFRMDVAVDSKDNIIIVGSISATESVVEIRSPEGILQSSFIAETNNVGHSWNYVCLAIDEKDQIVVGCNSDIQKIDRSGKVICRFTSNHFPEFCPKEICVNDQGQIVVCEGDCNRIQVFDEDGSYLFSIPSSSSTLEFDEISSGCINALDGYLYVVDKRNYRIRQFQPMWKPSHSNPSCIHIVNY